MMPFHSRCPDVAAREVRSVAVGPGPGGLPAGEYAFIEFYCADPECDCRRAFFQVIGRGQPERILASINFGWESLEFYRRKMPWDPKAPRQVVEGSLDPLNEQSEWAPALLKLFQDVVADEAYKARLKRHHDVFRRTLTRPPHGGAR